MGETNHGALVSVITGIITIIVFLIVIKVLNFYNEENKKKGSSRKMPPGRRGWPLIGDTFSWFNAVASSHPPTFVQKQAQRYGKIFSCSLFGKWAVVSTDPIFNKFVMQNEGKIFKSSYPKSFRDLVGKNGIITVQGDQQRKLHGIASNMMRLEKLKSHFLNDIQLIMTKSLTNFENNQEVCLQDVCRKIAINLMVNQLLGASSEGEVEEMACLFSNFVDGCLSLPINIHGFTYHTAMKARESIICKINSTIAMHRKQKKAESTEFDKSFGVLGRLLDEESLPNEAILADFMINLLFAGNETTSKTMLFAIYFLTRCPNALNQLLEEHISIKSESDGEGMLTWQDYKRMSFTQCVIDETLRLGGIAIWLMREATEDVEYQGYIIPKGCFVVPFLSAVHLDDEFYEGALSFNPWRWMDPQNQEKRNGRSGPFYAPFGGGARLCPGADLARLQIALFLHYFVTTYKWVQLKEDKMSFFPSARLVNGFQIRITTRDEDLKIT